MLNLNELLNTAPKTPALTGEWVSVYLEPMIGSGERLTIAVAAQCTNRLIDVRPAIRQEVIDVMFGHRSKAFNSMIEVIATSLKLHIENTGSFHTWVPPIGGVTLGRVKKAASKDLIGILRQAITLSSSLSTMLDDRSNLNSVKKQNKTEKDRWTTQLQQAVIESDTKRQGYFNAKYDFKNKRMAASVFYLSEHAAINTGKLLPSSLSNLVAHSKAKIADLSLIKSHPDLLHRDTHEFILFKPNDDDPRYNDNEIAKVNSAFLILKDLAEKDEIILTAVTDVQEGANRILRTAA
ncbi:hypothetical protein K151_2027 [Proteus hauseri ZMd44]|uniref:hypothetical protein n=1 Tax=Proteus terrae TaxID=1574161 RepID=UPI0003C58C26|nr:hypothetical protein [Proteus terrae]EST59197.1 hypothetical protein K151_2027 [Proteus hauseri ZMd44]